MVVPCVGMRMGDVMHLHRSSIGRVKGNRTGIHGFGWMVVRKVIVVMLLLWRRVNGRRLAVWWGWRRVGHGLGHWEMVVPVVINVDHV